jgi:hypothetical protein
LAASEQSCASVGAVAREVTATTGAEPCSNNHAMPGISYKLPCRHIDERETE